MKKTCKKCGEDKDESEFYWAIRDVNRKNTCKTCENTRKKDYYRNNKKASIARSRKSNDKKKEGVRAAIANYLLTHPCVDCGESDIVVLEFDHRYNKSSAVSRMFRARRSIEDIMEEISKCDVRCANCHRKRHSKENNDYRNRYGSMV